MSTRAAPSRAASRRTLAPAELAWAAALPCAILLVGAIALLGPPLADVLPGGGSAHFWPGIEVAPEPVEHARYAIALLGPALLAGIALRGARRALALDRGVASAAVAAGQLATAAVLAVALLAQQDVLIRAYVAPLVARPLWEWTTIAAAAALAVGAAVALRRTDAFALLARESRGRAVACALLAVGLTALWLSPAIDSDATAGAAVFNNLIPWDMSETFAVLGGGTPLVDFHAQYSQLLPYLSAAAMAVTGSTTLTTWTLSMALLDAVGLLAVYAVFRRVTRSSLAALLLYVPFLAISLFLIVRAGESRGTPATIFSTWPMRYSGPYVLAWLTCRHVAGRRPRRAELLMLAGGLVLLNNPEFGIGAFAATLAALVLVRPPDSWRALLGPARAAAVGLAGAAALVALLTLVRAGALPRFSLLLEFPRLYGTDGWVLEPMAPIGLHIVYYVTFTAAIVVAAVRAPSGRERPLTGMLVWSGVFGLIANSYFVGRSDALNLMALLSTWALALALLAVVVVRDLGRSRRRAGVPELAVLFGFALAACSVAHVPTPWEQATRLGHAAPGGPLFEQQAAKRLVARTTHPGERVAILIPLGHRIAYDAGVVDVSPYSGIEAMPTREQLQRAIDAVAGEPESKLYVSSDATLDEELAFIRAAGFAIGDGATAPSGTRYLELVRASGAAR